MNPVALTIAGSDPSGGAGIQADLKTFQQAGVYGESVITLVTAQNTTGIERVEVLPESLVAAQLEAVLKDIPPAVVKTGALGNDRIIETVARILRSRNLPVIVDPVMVSTQGNVLMDARGTETMKKSLLPLARLVTPNLAEAELLSGIPYRDLSSVEAMGKAILASGCVHVLIKGGHMQGPESRDFLISGDSVLVITEKRIATRHTHGTGCTLSAAIAAGLARGYALDQAVCCAKEYVTAAIRSNPGLGEGCGPLDHGVPFPAKPALSPNRTNRSRERDNGGIYEQEKNPDGG